MANLAVDILAHFLCKVVFVKNVAFSIAMLFAHHIMFGKKTFAEVPAKLKSKVRELLIDSGCEDLVTED